MAAWLIFAGLVAAALIGAAAVYLIPDMSAMIEAAREELNGQED